MRSLLIALLALAACGTSSRHASPFETLCADYWEWRMHSSPEWATWRGDHRWNDRLSDIGESGRRAAADATTKFLTRLRAISRESVPDRLSYDLLERQLTIALEEDQHCFWQWDIDALGGPQVSFLEQINVHPFRNEKDVRDLVARFRAFPQYMRDYILNLRAGLESGRVAPAAVVDRVKAQLAALIAKPSEEWALMDAIKKLRAAKIEPAEDLEYEIRSAVKITVRNAFLELQRFLDEDYKPRAEPGLGRLPGGAEAYRFRIRLHTTTDLTAEQIHRIGLEELAGIQKEMAAIAKKLGHDGDLKSFVAKVKADPANYVKTREELIALYRRNLAKAEAKLAQWFGRLPSISCKVKPIEDYREKDAPTAYYYSADEKRTRDAYFYANTYQPETRPVYSAMALTVHEAVPGHHLQIAIAQELKGLPEFRKSASSTAFVEGWALYTERLADEMGLYETDLERFGMLTYQAWRACRLVVDTGLHAMDWTRDQAIEFMVEHVADSRDNLTNEVDRYIAWPGQALAYKIGQREILALRAETEARLGGRFNIKAFHDVVLGNGPLPMPVLRKVVEAWDGERY